MAEESMQARVAVLERECEDFKSVVVEIRDAVQALVRLEEKHNETGRAIRRSFEQHEKMDRRVAEIEKQMPPLLEMRKLIVGAICVVLMAVGGAVMASIGIKGS